MATAASTADLQALKSCTKMLMNHVHVVQQSFNLLPDKEHYGACINYVDHQEFRDEFITELVSTVSEWVYSQANAKKKLATFKKQGRSSMNAQLAFTLHTFSKFRDRDSRKTFLQGQFGELLLFNFMQHFFGAVPLLRKMVIKTNPKMEINGADAIHYLYKAKKHLIFLGEAKAYKSKYAFKKAFTEAIKSVLNTYQTHLKEMDLYIYDNFVDDELIEVAQAYKNGELKNVELHMVSIIAYHETEKIKMTDEGDIKEQIMKVIAEKGKSLERSLFKTIPAHLHPRMTYIVMPIWEMEQLLDEFQTKLGK